MVKENRVSRYETIIEAAKPMLGVLSDNAVCDALALQGFQVDMSLVATWRRQLGIPAARQHRRSVEREWTADQDKQFRRAWRDNQAGVPQRDLARRLRMSESRLQVVFARLRAEEGAR